MYHGKLWPLNFLLLEHCSQKENVRTEKGLQTHNLSGSARNQNWGINSGAITLLESGIPGKQK